MRTKINRRLLRIIGYILLILFSLLWADINKLPSWTAYLTAVPVIVADIFNDFSPRIFAFIYAHRGKFVYGILGLCMCLAGFLYYKFPLHQYPNYDEQEKFILVTQFLFEGAIVGLTMRMLLLNLFADMLRARDIYIPKLLILVDGLYF